MFRGNSSFVYFFLWRASRSNFGIFTYSCVRYYCPDGDLLRLWFGCCTAAFCRTIIHPQNRIQFSKTTSNWNAHKTDSFQHSTADHNNSHPNQSLLHFTFWSEKPPNSSATYLTTFIIVRSLKFGPIAWTIFKKQNNSRHTSRTLHCHFLSRFNGRLFVLGMDTKYYRHYAGRSTPWRTQQQSWKKT